MVHAILARSEDALVQISHFKPRAVCDRKSDAAECAPLIGAPPYPSARVVKVYEALGDSNRLETVHARDRYLQLDKLPEPPAGPILPLEHPLF